ncbi:M23 family metallopeptidase [Streptomyces sp. NPDC047315]|uniref:M23 family metallopeptidase n=1 Tax=Streptomyces sp. NPDC047315 TaxID=3155142 RepID=UPI003410C418
MSARTHKALAMISRVCWPVLFVAVVLGFRYDFPFWAVVGPGLVIVVVDVVRLSATGTAHRATPQREPIEVDAPFAGRWLAHNSPADKVPSHGTHVYGQTYAVDVIAEPADGPARPPFSPLWPLARKPGEYPAYGAPLLATADATVVHASDGQRDHLSRTSWPGLIYLMTLESFVRSLGGHATIFGNRVVLDLGDGTYAAYAHLKRGSLRVRAGDKVTAGQQIAECGNSGNSSEPHLHFQLMDGHDLESAVGLPFTWRGVGLPANGEHFTPPAAAESAEPAAGIPPVGTKS